MAETITVDQCVAWLKDFRAKVEKNHEYLTELDSAIGDADHGINMDRGTAAAIEAIDKPGAADTIAGLFKTVAMTLISTVGGASGPLYGTFFLRFSTGVAGADMSAADLAAAFERGLAGILARGKAELGDKTMVDALTPAVKALTEGVSAGEPLAQALAEGRDACIAGRDATIPLVARKGRASYLGERSAGHQDPGATSMAMLWESAAATLA